jgi:uncharacterized protein YegP (UPF0339 family)
MELLTNLVLILLVIIGLTIFIRYAIVKSENVKKRVKKNMEQEYPLLNYENKRDSNYILGVDLSNDKQDFSSLDNKIISRDSDGNEITSDVEHILRDETGDDYESENILADNDESYDDVFDDIITDKQMSFGRISIRKSKNDKYYACLISNNNKIVSKTGFYLNEIELMSDLYDVVLNDTVVDETTEELATHRNPQLFTIFKSTKNDNYYFNYCREDGRVVLKSEGYKAKRNTIKAIHSIGKILNNLP